MLLQIERNVLGRLKIGRRYLFLPLLTGSADPLFDLTDYVRFFFSLPWKREVLNRILYKNALRALKLEDDPTFRKMYKLDLPDEEVDPTPEFIRKERARM